MRTWPILVLAATLALAATLTVTACGSPTAPPQAFSGPSPAPGDPLPAAAIRPAATPRPARTAAEYIDPARYHVLSVTVSVAGRRPHTVHQVITSQAFIARLARALDGMPAEPLGTVACPAIFADYRVAFSVSRSSRPVVVISANETGCGGAGITVDGRQQPALTDRGAVAALVDQVVSVAWET
jgi:hypothetical protein